MGLHKVTISALESILYHAANGKKQGWLSSPTRASVSAHFGLPWVRPWDNRGKCYMDGKRIQCWSKA